jgi:hypothetical protein
MTPSYVLHALTTALRTVRFDGKALDDYDRSFEGFFRSFFAAFLALPIHIFLSLGEVKVLAAASALSTEGSPAPAPEGFSYSLGDVFLYALDWVTFPIVMIGVTRLIGAQARYVPYIVAYNWGSFIVLLATVPPYLAYLSGAVPITGFVMLFYVSIAFVMAYRWMLAREVLKINAATAAGIVILDLLVSAVVLRFAAQMLGLY